MPTYPYFPRHTVQHVGKLSLNAALRLSSTTRSIRFYETGAALSSVWTHRKSLPIIIKTTTNDDIWPEGIWGREARKQVQEQRQAAGTSQKPDQNASSFRERDTHTLLLPLLPSNVAVINSREALHSFFLSLAARSKCIIRGASSKNPSLSSSHGRRLELARHGV